MTLLYYVGTSGDINELIKAGNRLLYYVGKDEFVSCRWAYCWVERNKDYWKTLRSKLLSAKRCEAYIQEDLDAYFKEYKRCVDYWGIQEEDQYNFDETGFQMGVVSGSKVIVPIDCDAVFILDLENRELLTAVVTLNSKAKKVPAMLIFKGAYHL